jgi:hypothetical protein
MLDPTDLSAKLKSSPTPLSFAKLKKAYGITKKTEPDLRAALASSGIFPWPKNSYWHTDPATHLQNEILHQCSAQARKKTEIKGPKKDLAAAIHHLLAEKKLIEYPALAGASKILVPAAAPQAYWSYVQSFVAVKLKKAGIEQPNLTEAKPQQPAPAETNLPEKIWEILPKLEPQKDVPVSTARLRRALGLVETGKAQFDQAALKLREQRRVYLSQHDHPLGLNPEDRDWLIDGKDGRYYVAITRRES